MDSTIIFEEVQGPAWKSVRDFFKGVTGLLIFCLLINLFWNKGVINEISVGLFSGVLLFTLASFLSERKLVMQIRSDGIYVRYPPLQPSFNKYPWDSIQLLYIRKYNAISEYGNYGIRMSVTGAGMAYIVSGDTGIQIIFNNDAKLLIGTQQPDEVAAILRKLGKLH